MLIEASGMPLPQLIEIDELPDLLDDDSVARGAEFLRSLTQHLGIPDARIAFLLARPGHDGVRALDRSWAASLHALARRAELVCEPVHLANDVRIVPIPLDELDAA